MSLKKLKNLLKINNINYLINNDEIVIANGVFTSMRIKKENEIFIGKIIIFFNDKGENIKFNNIKEIINYIKKI
jgi:hypothetical protein